MSNTTENFKKQLPRNSFFQITAFITKVVVGICLVPYLVRHLGIVAYGLIPIAGMLTEYVALISQSIANAVNRFLTIALQKKDSKEANCIFSTAFYSYLAIGVIQTPFFIIVIYYSHYIITIPDVLYKDAMLLLSFSAVSFIVNLISSVFGVSMYACNRLDLSRSIDIGRHVFRIAGIVILFIIFNPALRYVGYVEFTISILACAANIIISRRILPDLKLRIRYYDWRKIQPVVGMGGWLLVNSIGTLLFLRMDVWVCNRFVDLNAAGEYAALLQWPTLLRAGATILSGMIAPMIMIYYARSEFEQVKNLGKVSIRLLSLCIATPIGVICVLSGPLLGIWLGDSFSHLGPVIVIMLCHLIINVGVTPLRSIEAAMNKVKVPALMTLVMGGINLPLAILFAAYFNWGMYGVALAGAIVLTLKNGLFTPLYAAIILGVPWYTFLKPILSALCLFLGIVSIGYILKLYVNPISLFQLAFFSLVLGVLGIIATWFFLPKNERILMISLLPDRVKNILNIEVST